MRAVLQGCCVSGVGLRKSTSKRQGGNMARRTPWLIRRVLLVGSTALAMMVMGVQPAAAAGTLVVDDDGMATIADCNASAPAYPTISAAVVAASPGDTIKVCPGLYHEQVVINKDNLTLLGAQAGVDARTRPSVPDPTTQSIIDHECGPVQFE